MKGKGKRGSLKKSTGSTKTERGNSSSFGEGDRISCLPDSLIHLILSYMDIKFAVQTCVLSRRWRYIWTSLPVLQFSDMWHYYFLSFGSEVSIDEERAESSERFTKFVNRVLDLRDDSHIQRFHLEYEMCRSPVSEISRWIAAAVRRNVKELMFKSEVSGLMYNFKTEPKGGYEIPPCLFTCTSLAKLELRLCSREGKDNRIILPNEMSLPRLKLLRLCFEDLWFDDGNLTNKFFSSFPSLESLVMEMEYCRSYNMDFCISLPELKYFKFESRGGCGGSNIQLHAPSLVSFIFDGFMSTSFTLENLSSLVTADITIMIQGEDSHILAEVKEIYVQRAMGLLRGIHNVGILTLDCDLLKALGGAPYILDTQPLEFTNLQHLKLKTYLSRDCLRSIFYILKNSPNLESVSLLSEGHCWDSPRYPYCDEVKLNPENIGDYWDAGSLSCMTSRVKYLEIKELCGRVNELKFLETLLKHAAVLEKVILNACYICSTREQDSQMKTRMKKFGEMLLNFPTASKKILILLNS